MSFERYLNQMQLPEIGLGGQQRLQKSSVLIVGCGGLGTPVATWLASMGVGRLGLSDGDIVQIGNLHRQFQYTPQDVGQLKTTALANKLQCQNPNLHIETYGMVTQETKINQVQSYEVICDCTDNASSRLTIDQLCRAAQTPLVYAAIRDWQGYLTVLHHNRKIKLEQIFSTTQLEEASVQNCASAGIMSPLCGVIGSLQAIEVIKILLGQESNLDGGILYMDTLTYTNRIFRLYG